MKGPSVVEGQEAWGVLGCVREYHGGGKRKFLEGPIP